MIAVEEIPEGDQHRFCSVKPVRGVPGGWGSGSRPGSFSNYDSPSTSVVPTGIFSSMTQQQYPRSPKALLGGMAHLGRFIDKIRMRNAGKIQDYNYITVGFDKHLIDFLGIDAKAFEQRVLAGGTDEELLAWIVAQSKAHSHEDIAQWSRGLLSSGPNDDAACQRFQGRLQDIANKRGVSVSSLPPVSTWADVIELDEGRM